MSKKSFFFYGIVLFFILSITACNKDNEADDMRSAIVGTWKLISLSVDGTNADTSSYPDLIQFQSSAIFQAYNTSTSVKIRGEWSYDGSMLNISSYLPAAFYIVNVDGQGLTLKRFDFNTDGSLKTTIQQYQRTADSDIK
jgi:hypothetical protein